MLGHPKIHLKDKCIFLFFIFKGKVDKYITKQLILEIYGRLFLITYIQPHGGTFIIMTRLFNALSFVRNDD